MKFFYVWTDRQSIIKTDRLTDRPHQPILRSSLPELRNIFCFFTSILTVFVSIAEVISSSLAYSMFCSYWTHLGPTSLLESLGAEIVRILDLVTHSNNFDFLDKIQNLSEYIFRGDSLSRNHFFTHSLTHSLTDKSWKNIKRVNHLQSFWSPSLTSSDLLYPTSFSTISYFYSQFLEVVAQKSNIGAFANQS